MLIITDNEAVKQSLARAFADLPENLVLIDVCLASEGSGKKRIDRYGLEKAMEYDPVQNPVILYGLEDEKYLRKKSNIFRRLMAKGRVGYARMPVRLDEVRALAQKLIAASVIADPLADFMVEVETVVGLIQILRHDLGNAARAEDGAKVIALCERARKELGVAGSDDEVLKYILEFEPKKYIRSGLAGRTIKGVFCDIDGTLLVKEGFLNQHVLLQLQEFEQAGKGIALWTGGEVESRRNALIDYGVFYKVLSKHHFEGCIVEIAIDDSPEALRKEYGIMAEKIIKV